jgi:uncharacterized surface anchored protein
MRDVDRLDQQGAQRVAAGRALVAGQVSAADGGALPGAVVTLADLSGRQVAVARTDTEGRYEVTGPGAGTYLVIASAAGHQPSASLVMVTSGPARHDAVLRSAGGLAGTVRAAGSGKPIGGATVTVADGRGEIIGAALTSPDGTFTLTDLDAGDYTLVVAAASCQPAALRVTLPRGQRVRRDVELAATGRVTGSVLAAQREVPFPGALLSLLSPSGEEVASAVADADGRFAFDDVPPGSYTVVATGYQPGAVTLRAGSDLIREADITLGAPGR